MGYRKTVRNVEILKRVSKWCFYQNHESWCPTYFITSCALTVERRGWTDSFTAQHLLLVKGIQGRWPRLKAAAKLKPINTRWIPLNMAGFFKPEDVPELMLETTSSRRCQEKVLLIESVHHVENTYCTPNVFFCKSNFKSVSYRKMCGAHKSYE